METKEHQENIAPQWDLGATQWRWWFGLFEVVLQKQSEVRVLLQSSPKRR